MKLKSKRIIAREFLIFFICLLVGVISLCWIYPYNYYVVNKAEKFESERIEYQSKYDSLAKAYNFKKKRKEDFTQKVTNRSYPDNKMWQDLVALAKRDGVTKWWKTFDVETLQFMFDYNIHSADEFKRFILSNEYSDKDLADYKLALTHRNTIDYLKQQKHLYYGKIIKQKDQLPLALKILLSSIILAFGLRYLIYGLIWSVKTLKEKP